MSAAFNNAAVGRGTLLTVRRYCRINATAPAVSGVAMLVPPMWKYIRLAGNAPQAMLFEAICVERVERMKVPGATTSGLMPPSSVGPRLLNATTSADLLAIGSLRNVAAG